MQLSRSSHQLRPSGLCQQPCACNGPKTSAGWNAQMRLLRAGRLLLCSMKRHSSFRGLPRHWRVGRCVTRSLLLPCAVLGYVSEFGEPLAPPPARKRVRCCRITMPRLLFKCCIADRKLSLVGNACATTHAGMVIYGGIRNASAQNARPVGPHCMRLLP